MWVFVAVFPFPHVREEIICKKNNYNKSGERVSVLGGFIYLFIYLHGNLD